MHRCVWRGTEEGTNSLLFSIFFWWKGRGLCRSYGVCFCRCWGITSVYERGVERWINKMQQYLFGRSIRIKPCGELSIPRCIRVGVLAWRFTRMTSPYLPRSAMMGWFENVFSDPWMMYASHYATRWKLSISSSKCEAIRYTRKQNQPSTNIIGRWKSSVVYLAITLDPKLTMIL